jgi:hypothetical protein
MPNLVVTVTFNPPVIKLIGSTLREETLKKLEVLLPKVTTTSVSKDPPKFTIAKDPPHWHMEISQQFCDHLGRSLVFMAIIETLEAEDWTLRASNSMVHFDTGRDTNKFFFARA